MSFKLKNITNPAIDIQVNDLGITVYSTIDYNLALEPAHDVTSSQDLKDLVANDSLIILDQLDGVTQLSKSDSLELLSIVNDPPYKIIFNPNTTNIWFSAKSQDFLINGNLTGLNASIAGYVFPDNKTITDITINTDSNNSNEFELLINDVVVHTTHFLNEKYKTTVLSLPYTAEELITARYRLDNYANINVVYTEDANTLFLAHMDAGNDSSRQVINSSTILKGMTGRNIGPQLNQSGPINKAYSFDGVNDYVKILHNEAYDIQDCTIEFWFKTDTISGTHTMISKDSSHNDTGGHVFVQLVDNDIQIRTQSISSTLEPTIDTSILVDTWYHLALVLGVGGVKLFLDGVNIYSNSSWTQGLNGNRELFTIGASGWKNGDGIITLLENYWTGDIAEFRLSNTRRYENNFTVHSTNLINDVNTVGLWLMNETSGFLMYDESDTVTHAMIQSLNFKDDYFHTLINKFGTHSIGLFLDDWFKITHTPDFEMTAATFECWMYKVNTSKGTIFKKGRKIITKNGTIYTPGYIELTWLDNKLTLVYAGDSTIRTMISATDTFIQDSWFHIAVTINDIEIILYINGIIMCSETLTGDYGKVMLDNKEDLYIGIQDDMTSSGLEGYIDEFRVSNIVRMYPANSPVKDINMLVELK